jgi:hypothetical protein
MKLRLSQITNSWELLQKIVPKELPIKQSYWMQKNFKLIEPEMKQYEEQRIKLISEKYGKKIVVDGKETESMEVPPENREGFFGELIELQSIELELDIHKIKFPEDFKMTPQEVSLLLYMIDIDDEEKKEEKNNG